MSTYLNEATNGRALSKRPPTTGSLSPGQKEERGTYRANGEIDKAEAKAERKTQESRGQGKGHKYLHGREKATSTSRAGT